MNSLRNDIESLSQGFGALSSWFLEFDARVWDEQIETDLKAGKLDTLITEARTEFEQGKARPL